MIRRYIDFIYLYEYFDDVNYFVELGGGVDDVPGWRRARAYVELGFR